MDLALVDRFALVVVRRDLAGADSERRQRPRTRFLSDASLGRRHPAASQFHTLRATMWYKPGPPMSVDSTQLRRQLKEFIVRRLRLARVDPAGIADDAPLFGRGQRGLDLDSIDLLELVVGLEKEYGLKIADVAEGRKALASVASLAAYVSDHRGTA